MCQFFFVRFLVFAWGRFVFRLRVFGFAFVFNISDVAILVGLVGDDLSATIGKDNAVRSGDNFAVAALLVSVIVLALVILHRPVKAVRFRGLGKNNKFVIVIAPFQYGNRRRRCMLNLTSS